MNDRIQELFSYLANHKEELINDGEKSIEKFLITAENTCLTWRIA